MKLMIEADGELFALVDALELVNFLDWKHRDELVSEIHEAVEELKRE